MGGDTSLMSGDPALRAVADAYWEDFLRQHPVEATFLGDHRYDEQLPDVGPSGRAEEAQTFERVRAGLRDIDRGQLDAGDQVTWTMLEMLADMGRDMLRLRLDGMAVDQLAGPQVWLPELLNWQPMQTREEIERLVLRYRAFPRSMQDYLDALRDGVREGRTAPRIAVERVLGQLQALLSRPVPDSVFAEPIRSGVADSDLAGEITRAIEEAVYPAYHAQQEFLQDYLASAARKEPGVWSVTDGAEIYALLARQHTTTRLSPDELHQIGLNDLAGIHGEMQEILKRLGDTSGDVSAFTQRLTHEAGNLPSTQEEIVERAQQLVERAYQALPRAFGRLPKAACVVRPIESYREKDAPTAYYYQPAPDGSRPGIFYVNTYEPASRPRHALPAVVFHEAVPGHHLQIALSQEAEGLPAFRRYGTLGTNAFIEGWGLYAERLGDELGLYPDDLTRFGMLGYQAWRACRLVVDTGLHALRWSRQQAIDFFLNNVGLTEHEIVNEVDRYIIWPGQALSYKVGQREIERVRAERSTQDGSAFDLRAFHDDLLAQGAVPLEILPSLVGLKTLDNGETARR